MEELGSSAETKVDEQLARASSTVEDEFINDDMLNSYVEQVLSENGFDRFALHQSKLQEHVAASSELIAREVTTQLLGYQEQRVDLLGARNRRDAAGTNLARSMLDLILPALICVLVTTTARTILPPSEAAAVYRVALLVVAAFSARAVLFLALRQVRARKLKIEGMSLRAESREVEAAIRRAVADRVLLYVNRENLSSPPERLFSQVETQSLSASKSPELMRTERGEEVSAYFDRYESATIGISGPRGVGKSTLLRSISLTPAEQAVIGVYLQIPVFYERQHFVRSLHRAVALAILEREERLQSRPFRPKRAGRPVVRGAAFLSAVGVALIVLSFQFSPAFTYLSSRANAVTLVGLSLLGLGLMMGLGGWRRQHIRRWVTDDPTSVEQLIREQLDLLHFSRTRSQKTKSSLKLSQLGSQNDEESTQSVERELSHPEQVAALRSFIGSYLRLRSHHKIVVALDELDKIAEPSKAIELVNNLKDLFGVPGSHYCLTVSTDALASFALRGVPVRDAFESSFDNILDLQGFLVFDSLEMIDKRVFDFPAPATLVCHALSGGLPREFIRLAQACAEKATATPGSTVYAVCERVTTEVVTGAAKALLTRFPEHSHPSTHSLLRLLLMRLATSSPFALDVVNDLVRLPAIHASSGSDLPDGDFPSEMRSYYVLGYQMLRFAKIVLAREDWNNTANYPQLCREFQRFAELRMEIAVSPESVTESVLADIGSGRIGAVVRAR